LEEYDKYWDAIRTEPTLIADAEAKGIALGREEGEEIGIQKSKIAVVINSFENKIPISLIANITQLSEDDVVKILKENGKL
jgi:hypothetical protein